MSRYLDSVQTLRYLDTECSNVSCTLSTLFPLCPETLRYLDTECSNVSCTLSTLFPSCPKTSCIQDTECPNVSCTVVNTQTLVSVTIKMFIIINFKHQIFVF